MSTDSNSMDQIQTLQLQLLNKVDELRENGVGGLVDLPQIVVCGSQSSGKGDVLEAISRMTFTTKRSPCTRFITEFVLRRAPQKNIKVWIRPGDSKINGEGKQKPLHFSSDEIDMSSTSFSFSKKLKELMERASSCIGLSSTALEISGDVLKVEISGPQQPELTLVDLPALPHSTNIVQNAEGKKMIQSLTERYIRNPRTIVLAVISANFDCHDQSILSLLKQFDPKYERVLGIITQPDIAEVVLDKQKTSLQFIKNEKTRLGLGWHVLLSRGVEKQRISNHERDVREKKFFDQEQCVSLSPSQFGIEALRHRLSSSLLCLIHRNLPDLITDIQNKIMDSELEIEKMGAPRATIQEQRQYLVDISSRFGRITNQALNGSYVDEFFGGFREGMTSKKELDFRRLRAVIREMNESFEDAITLRGARRIIQSRGSTIPAVDTEAENTKPYMHGWKPVYVTQDSLEREVEDLMHRSRDIDLTGSAAQLLVSSLFRDQCEPWEKIAQSHILNAWSSVECFVQLVLKHLTDDHTRSSLSGIVFVPEMDKMKDSLLAKLGELCLHYKSSYPLPAGRLLLSRFQASRNKRQISTSDNTAKPNPSSQKPTGCLQPTNIIDHMQAYYKASQVSGSSMMFF